LEKRQPVEINFIHWRGSISLLKIILFIREKRFLYTCCEYEFIYWKCAFMHQYQFYSLYKRVQGN